MPADTQWFRIHYKADPKTPVAFIRGWFHVKAFCTCLQGDDWLKDIDYVPLKSFRTEYLANNSTTFILFPDPPAKGKK